MLFYMLDILYYMLNSGPRATRVPGRVGPGTRAGWDPDPGRVGPGPVDPGQWDPGQSWVAHGVGLAHVMGIGIQ